MLRWILAVVLLCATAYGDPSIALSPEEVTPFETQWRPATITKIIDGDTAEAAISLGFNVSVTVRVRLIGLTGLKDSKIGIDAWEVRGPTRAQGLAAKARVEELAPVGSQVLLASRKGGSKESLGRWLCCILVKQGSQWTSLGDLLVREGHAQVWWKDRRHGAPKPQTSD